MNILVLSDNYPPEMNAMYPGASGSSQFYPSVPPNPSAGFPVQPLSERPPEKRYISKKIIS